MKNVKSVKKFSLPKISLKKGNRYIDNSVILINGIVFTCILLSIASGFIDLTFFSGLSKSVLHLATLPLPAAVLYTIISVGFISGKFWCAMQIGMFRELQTRLVAQGLMWGNDLKKARIGWHVAHKFLIAVSIVTALSLSFNSIGAGIRNMEQNIKNMATDVEQLVMLQNSVRDGVNKNRDAKKDSISGQKNAQKSVIDSFEEKWKYVVEYRAKREELDTEAEDYKTQLANLKRVYASKAPEGVTQSNIDWIDEYTVKNKLLENAKKFEVIDSSSYIEESIAYDKSEIESTLKALADKEYRTPDGELISFVKSDGSLVDIQLAISRLQAGIAHWQSDTGDAGESSKIFTLIAAYINADAKAGGMGISEWLMVIFIFLAGIVQEYLIFLFTPKATIDRKLLSQVSHYMKWKNEEEKERFLISVYISYAGDGILNQDRFEAKCKKAVYFMELNPDDIIAKYSSKKKEHKITSIKTSTIHDKVYEENALPKVDIDGPILNPVKVATRSNPSGEPRYSQKVDQIVKEIEEEIKKA